jgi:predicted PhzF superfamily epimerase YddE/YHI9
MTPSAPYYHVDAFAERPFTGNQAGNAISVAAHHC